MAVLSNKSSKSRIFQKQPLIAVAAVFLPVSIFVDSAETVKQNVNLVYINSFSLNVRSKTLLTSEVSFFTSKVRTMRMWLATSWTRSQLGSVAISLKSLNSVANNSATCFAI